MPANLRKEPKWREHKRGANPGSASIRRSTFAPHLTKPTFAVIEKEAATELGREYPSHALIVLFGALGVVIPIALLLLSRSEVPDLFGFIVLVWPTSIFATEIQQSHGSIAFLLPVLGNAAIYLIFGSLFWFGLARPRSIVYLTIVGLMYMMVVGVAAFCQMLLSY